MRSGLSRTLSAALAVAVGGVALLTAGGFLDGRAFPGELLALFRLQYLAAAAVLTLAATAVRRRRTALAAGAAALANTLGLLPALFDDARPDPLRPQLRLLVANVSHANEDYAGLVALVERERPTVVGLTELTPGWTSALDRPLSDFGHRVLEPQRSAYGLGLYSRRRLRSAQVALAGGKPPVVGRVSFELDGGRLELFLVHAPGVVGRRAATRQRAFMRELGGLVREAGPATLVCGDLNAAPWSRPLRELMRAGALERAEAWRPGEWSFPAWNRALATPIDQCLAGERVRVATRVGPAFGSDHRPLLVEVELAGG